jgi:transposase InsO family protein
MGEKGGCIPTTVGWRYLAVVIDLFSRKIVGWSLAAHMRADRGSQYGSKKFRTLLSGIKARQSMSARANPYDNAWTESFMGTLKNEMLQNGVFLDESDARTELFAYIDGYYNTCRKHSSLVCLSPSKFESKSLHQN